MKKLYIYIILGIGLLLAACDAESSDNGDLDGFWVMQSMEYAPTGWVKTDMRSSGITWSFGGSILELRDLNAVQQDIVASFEREGDKLFIRNFYFVERDEGDRAVEDGETYLRPYGIGANGQYWFQIEELTSKRMRLSSELFRLEFRKY